MSRHLDNLKRVFQKLQIRYGENDPMVLQVKQELESRQVIESRYPGSGPSLTVRACQGLPRLIQRKRGCCAPS
ncbi:MAG: hypothetical protein Q7S97_04075 [Polaromonas sp.]|nr:hypothetical protein [Polaromonas sp.]